MMRVVMDMQACQSEASAGRGIGRYATALARAMAGDAGHDEGQGLATGVAKTVHQIPSGQLGVMLLTQESAADVLAPLA